MRLPVIATIITCFAAFVATAPAATSFVSRAADSDPMPYVGKREMQTALQLQSTQLVMQITNVDNKLTSLILEGQIRTTWHNLCTDIMMKNMMAADSDDKELAKLQTEYHRVMGFEYPLRQCY